jgi:hypothetical protein
MKIVDLQLVRILIVVLLCFTVGYSTEVVRLTKLQERQYKKATCDSILSALKTERLGNILTFSDSLTKTAQNKLSKSSSIIYEKQLIVSIGDCKLEVFTDSSSLLIIINNMLNNGFNSRNNDLEKAFFPSNNNLNSKVDHINKIEDMEKVDIVEYCKDYLHIQVAETHMRIEYGTTIIQNAKYINIRYYHPSN